MKPIHVPRINARYWAAITLASVFGTNLGDLYAHESGLGIVVGLAVLAALVCGTFLAERFDRIEHQIYYWLVIIIIRTGATNIADYLAFRVHVSPILLSAVLAAIIAAVAYRAGGLSKRDPDGASSKTVPTTDTPYWIAMLAAGVFGTVVGDVAQHVFGQVPASVGLAILLIVTLLWRNRQVEAAVALYWLTVTVARTAGTAFGDLLAENPSLEIGLPVATACTGIAFVAVLLLWPSRFREAHVTA